jgi:hypothetical protein
MRGNRKLAVMTTLLAFLVGSIAMPASLSAKPGSAEKASAGSESGKEVYTGTIVFMGGRFSGRSTTFSLTIDSATPRDDFDKSARVLKSKGQDGLLDDIRHDRRGRIQIGGQVGQDLNIVRIAEDDEGGKKITAAFARWMTFGELRAGTRTVDYPFTYLEFIVDSKGKGSGTFIPAAKISFDKKHEVVEVENFGAFPARLMGVRKRS